MSHTHTYGAQLVVELFLSLPRVVVDAEPTNQPTNTHTARPPRRQNFALFERHLFYGLHPFG